MDFKEARKILKKYDLSILKRTKNVNGVAIQKDGDDWIMNVLVTEKRNSHRWFETLNLEGLPVRVKEVGEIYPIALRTDKWRPAPGGVSIGHYQITAGTLGSTVYKDGQKMILSNNHVLANKNNAEIGDDIYQPGPFDGGSEADKIGELFDFVSIVFNDPENPNLVDCALCKPTNEEDVLDSIIDLDCPTGKKEAEINELVTKSGRTTGTTEEPIIAFSGIISVDFGSGQIAYFDDQILTDCQSAGGDSGSLLIDKETKEAVGLLFAGSSSITVFNRATKVAELLGIKFFGELPRAVLEVKYNIPHIALALEAKHSILTSSILQGRYGIWPPTFVGQNKIQIGKDLSSSFAIQIANSMENIFDISLFDELQGKYNSLLTSMLDGKYELIAPIVPKTLENLYDILFDKDIEANYNFSIFLEVISKYNSSMRREFISLFKILYSEDEEPDDEFLERLERELREDPGGTFPRRQPFLKMTRTPKLQP